MFKFVNKKIFLGSALLSSLLLFDACSKDVLIMKAYTPPKHQKEVKEMLASNESSAGFLNLEIYDDVDYIAGKGASLEKKDTAKKLLSSLKKYITQTDFISISGVADTSSVSLDMQIIKFDYKESEANGIAKIEGLVEVAYNIRKDSETFYTQNYKKSIKRQTRGGKQSLPSKSEIISEIADYLAKKLIKDISPVKTSQLIELASLPDELEYTIKYAKSGNFKGAIKAMENYKGEKTYEYYFNLAVYYEGLSAKEEDLALLTKTDAYYERAMALGGSEDESILKGKTQFDKFYGIIKKVAQQKVKNQKQNEDNKYELLD